MKRPYRRRNPVERRSVETARRRCQCSIVSTPACAVSDGFPFPTAEVDPSKVECSETGPFEIHHSEHGGLHDSVTLSDPTSSPIGRLSGFELDYNNNYADNEGTVMRETDSTSQSAAEAPALVRNDPFCHVTITIHPLLEQ